MSSSSYRNSDEGIAFWTSGAESNALMDGQCDDFLPPPASLPPIPRFCGSSESNRSAVPLVDPSSLEGQHHEQHGSSVTNTLIARNAMSQPEHRENFFTFLGLEGSRDAVFDSMLDLPSVGSVLHATGACLPCKFHMQRVGCKDGMSCNFCHCHHSTLTQSQVKKMFRNNVKKYKARYVDNNNLAFTF
eukprot:TRINITY_DN58234_c0_g1_i1.p1 TRINITY_DN58234_c0_g1~~TRINITY_DN58234_c0_g1_i1.p1  ORF type:complete len:188 (-),score=18.04 TRINITY_DN58234_c0_g1_i1:197-760(-)